MSGAITAAAVVAVGGMVSANQQKKAAKGAANKQSKAAQAGIDEQRRQFDAIQAMLAPYIQAGSGALGGQQALLGLLGADAQREALKALQESEQFKALTQQGEEAILQNASATGGLRGGNTQAALLQFRPQMLSQLIEQRFGQLGQLAQLGQASAAGQASAGLQTGRTIADLLGQQGAAQAGGILSGAAANTSALNALSQGIGMYGTAKKWW